MAYSLYLRRDIKASKRQIKANNGEKIISPQRRTFSKIYSLAIPKHCPGANAACTVRSPEPLLVATGAPLTEDRLREQLGRPEGQMKRERGRERVPGPFVIFFYLKYYIYFWCFFSPSFVPPYQGGRGPIP